jgi:hypothetical protein
MSFNKKSLTQVCLFEEYIYNLFLHFARICQESGRIVLPVFFKKQRISFNDQLDAEMKLMGQFYSTFRMLGQGGVVATVIGLPDHGMEEVKQIWAAKVEFIFALKEFYKTNILPEKKQIDTPKIESLVSKKKNDIDGSGKQGNKLKTFLEASNENKIGRVSDIDRKVTKLKTFVAKAFLKSSNPTKIQGAHPLLSKATKKLMHIQELLKVHETDPLRLRRFSLKRIPESENFLICSSQNIPSNSQKVPSTHYLAELANPSQSTSTGPSTTLSKSSIVHSYLRLKYVSKEKMF